MLRFTDLMNNVNKGGVNMDILSNKDVAEYNKKNKIIIECMQCNSIDIDITSDLTYICNKCSYEWDSGF